MKGRHGVEREFLMARSARERYDFHEALFTLRGETAAGDLPGARELAWRMNRLRQADPSAGPPVSAGNLYVMGLIEEILHHLIRRHVREKAPGAFAAARRRLAGLHGEDALRQTLLRLTALHPPQRVHREGLAPADWLAGETAGTPNGEVALEESILLSLANRNPAYAPYRELCDDTPLRRGTVYPELLGFFDRFFRELPPAGPGGESLVELLRAPAEASPESLEGQLRFIMERYAALVAPFMGQILTGLDIIREERRPAFAGFGGPAPAPGLRPGDSWGELHDRDEERYSLDMAWMPNLVLMAKSVYVWLHQLSVRHGREIARLDQVPDAELDTLARWGFTGLWLIGLWERSAASREIKRRCGNPEAEASAYSLYDYVIAGDLGGEAALENLRERAAARGIRLASDMVPNHVGIWSRWVLEHPDWFVQLDHPPFPSYRYTGPDLSADPSVSIRIEDGYWSRTDAAVAFQRVDNRTGEVRYIYHGNDGTGLPWNDTAQLDYLNPAVREAVLGTILHVARQFPVVRFDAAMTLTRRHYQRLWYPPPGTGGDIPSRAGHGLPGPEFRRRFGEEFWREVVDRCAADAHGTLLLAEAFWLLEGYFVRTLGMHRVYNSAFMNMLKREANAEYRRSLKEVLEYDPEILKRFVNFMNNPDEETAVAQFGKGDKYVGTCVLLATLPGLPMFGHGQVEGFSERYGMEYRRSYHDETPDEGLVARHEREIFPLLRRRWLFAGADRFALYDLVRDDGGVAEDVYVYSNAQGQERGLVVFNNVWGHAAGWIRQAAPVLRAGAGGRAIARPTLGEELSLDPSPGMYCRFVDAVTGLEYLRENAELRRDGLYLSLGAFRHHVFLDFRQFRDEDGSWGEVHRRLAGQGVPSLDEARREVLFAPLHAAFQRLLEEGAAIAAGAGGEEAVARWQEVLAAFLSRACGELGSRADGGSLAEAASADLRVARRLRPDQAGPVPLPAARAAALEATVVPAWLALRRLEEVAAGGPGEPAGAAELFDGWLLGREAERVWRVQAPEEAVRREVDLLRVLLKREGWLAEAQADPGGRLEELLADTDARLHLGVHRHGESVWLVKERLDELLWLLLRAARFRVAALPAAGAAGRLAAAERLAAGLAEAARRAGYRVDRFLEEAVLLAPGGAEGEGGPG